MTSNVTYHLPNVPCSFLCAYHTTRTATDCRVSGKWKFHARKIVLVFASRTSWESIFRSSAFDCGAEMRACSCGSNRYVNINNRIKLIHRERKSCEGSFCLVSLVCRIIFMKIVRIYAFVLTRIKHVIDMKRVNGKLVNLMLIPM